MLAVVVRAIGGPEVVEVAEVPRANPGPGQVRIKVAAAALNPADAAVWMGVWGPVEEGQHLSPRHRCRRGRGAARLGYLSALAEVGMLTPRVAQIYPLAQAAEAHARLIEGGRRGRIVLLP
jgi:NADPH:quinone reductase-like Zn-dependent oxidoreductase